MEKIQMDTMVSCLQHLEETGYTSRFKATADGLLSLETGKLYHTPQIKVSHFYRFEGESNPSDNAIVYAIEAGGERGSLTDGYGTESDTMVSDLIRDVTDFHK